MVESDEEEEEESALDIPMHYPSVSDSAAVSYPLPYAPTRRDRIGVAILNGAARLLVSNSYRATLKTLVVRGMVVSLLHPKKEDTKG